MPRRGWIDKSTATTYQILHRPQNDPQLHDEEASAVVFQEVGPSQAPRKFRSHRDLEHDLFGDGDSVAGVRDNEGEAAEHGVYFDDTEYDYMQHLRELGGGGGEGGAAVWVEAPQVKGKGKGKALDEALKDLDLTGEKAKITDESILPSKNLQRTTYQNQQEVPDEIAGFQPDMDPRLREVLEALEDEAYVDDDEAEGEDLFAEIAQDGEEISLEEFEDQADSFYDDEADWESDHTARPEDEALDAHPDTAAGPPAFEHEPSLPLDRKDTDVDDETHGDGDFMATFRDLPKAARAPDAPAPQQRRRAPGSAVMTAASSALTSGRRKKRRGARTDASAFSMTSSSLARTEGLELLDRRFERTLEAYEEEDEEGYDDGESYGGGGDDDMSVATGMTGATGKSHASAFSSASQAPRLVVRQDFEDVMDEFLATHSMQGKRRVKKGKQTGMEQLDEIRRELGRPVGKHAPRAKVG